MSKEETENSLRALVGSAAEQMSPAEIAGMAVIAAHVRANMEADRNGSSLTESNHPGDCFPLGYMFMSVVEDELVKMLQNNGSVVRNIGHAAKQINPLLS